MKKKRQYYSDEEVAMVVGGYRLTDGYERDYAAKMGINQSALSYFKSRAAKMNLRAKFPEFFGDAIATDATLHVVDHRQEPEIRYVVDEALERKIRQLESEVDTMKATNIRLANQLEKAKRRLGNAIHLLLDDDLKGE